VGYSIPSKFATGMIFANSFFSKRLTMDKDAFIPSSSDEDSTGTVEAAVVNRTYKSIHDKIGLCLEAERRVNAEKELSLKAFCREHDLQPSQLRRWQKNIVRMKSMLEDTTKKKAKKVCTVGRPSRLEKIRDKLIPWIESFMVEGKTLSIRLVSIQAKRYDRSLRRMKRYTVFAMVRRFLRSNGIVIRQTTHKSQDDPRTKHETAHAFLSTTCALMRQTNRSNAFIINMDQTPYNPKDTQAKTLARKGAKTVTAREIKTSVGRVSALLAVCADGTKLPPLIVMKGKAGGSIERELKDFPTSCKFIVQDNAWTDERVMLFWVDNVLRPYVQTAPAGIVPYLLLDKYKCHYQGSVANAIEDLGVEWDIIPGGCTSLVQPIDVGIGKPWKYRMRNRMEEWVMMQTTDRVKPKEARLLIANWAADAWDRLPNDVVFNSWRKHPFSYFPGEPTREGSFLDDNIEYSDDDDDNADADNNDGNDDIDGDLMVEML
jgi:hypothetical protein